MVKNNGHRVALTLVEAKELAIKLRREGKKIVLTQGSWDMIHVGHARYLAEAKKHGDVLLVGTDSDEKIRYRKGKGRPVVPEDERLEMLTYLGSVDYVVLKQLEALKYSLIKAVKPDVLVVIKQNYSDEKLKEIRKYCKKVKVLPRMAMTSTSAKLRRVQIGQAKKIESKLLKAIEGVLEEFRN
ncbi:MAG: adenylyltransferase/cytidyltransferase family protein [Patescibacteria group bacterium]